MTGDVTEVDTKEATVRLAAEVEARLKASEVRVDRVDDVRQALAVGDEITAKIIGIDRRNRLIDVSIRACEQDEERQAQRDYQRQEAEQRPGPTTLGDLIREQMNRDQS